MPENNDFENDSAVYKTLLESTRAIPWKIDWPTMRFAYIGPQIEPCWAGARPAGSAPRTGPAASTRRTGSGW
jgi:hypothetical protein